VQEEHGQNQEREDDRKERREAYDRVRHTIGLAIEVLGQTELRIVAYRGVDLGVLGRRRSDRLKQVLPTGTTWTVCFCPHALW
jgi:hypothetical protein